MTLDCPDRPVPPRLRPMGPIIRAQEAGLWSQAEAAVAEAQAYGERMAAWIQAAYEREKERGFTEGRAAGAAEAARLVAATAAEADRFARALERSLPDLVLGLVERILGALDPGDVLARAVTHAVGKLRTGAEIHLRVAPDHVEDLRRALADLPESPGTPTLRIDADPGLAPGACVLESAFGNVELGIEAQIEALRAGLAQAWGAAGARRDATPEDTGAAAMTPLPAGASP